MTGRIPEFREGEPPRAADVDALVQTVRALLASQWLLSEVRRPARVMHPFTRAGSAIARVDAEGAPVALGAEILWQLGPHVALLPGAPVEGVQAALEAANGQAAVGLHADVRWRRVAVTDYAATLEPTGVTWSAAPWLPPAENEAGEVIKWYYHGDEQAGCVLPSRGHHGQPQRALTMWPMPQLPLLASRQDYGEDVGCLALLPSPAPTQVLARAYGGYYTAAGVFSQVSHQWLAGLDKHGRLAFSASNFVP